MGIPAESQKRVKMIHTFEHFALHISMKMQIAGFEDDLVKVTRMKDWQSSETSYLENSRSSVSHDRDPGTKSKIPAPLRPGKYPNDA